jgi:hypothetical protein
VKHASTLWLALVTALWAGPVLAFALLHVRQPPGSGAIVPFLMLSLLTVATWLRPPRPLLRLRSREIAGRPWQRIGIDTFAAIAPNGRMLRRAEAASRSRAPGRPLSSEELRHALRRAESNESLHITLLLGGCAIAIWAISLGSPNLALYLALAAVPLNLYPIALQRHTRGRLVRAIERSSRHAISRRKQ